jgi:hypothetical protein
MVEQNKVKKTIENNDTESMKKSGYERITRFVDLSINKAALIIGFGLITMFFIAMIVEFAVFSELIVPGDATETVNNIKANGMLFGGAIAGYIIILMLDVLTALALYIILKPTNKDIALLASGLRVIYVAIMGFSLIALVFLFPSVYSYGKLVAYIFFISHIFTLGYLIIKSGYIPRSLGIFLIIASFSYIILLYGEFILPQEWYESLLMIAMLPATFAEPTLAIWVLVKRRKLLDMESKNENVISIKGRYIALTTEL